MMSGKDFLKSHVLSWRPKGVFGLGRCCIFWQGIPGLALPISQSVSALSVTHLLPSGIPSHCPSERLCPSAHSSFALNHFILIPSSPKLPPPSDCPRLWFELCLTMLRVINLCMYVCCFCRCWVPVLVMVGTMPVLTGTPLTCDITSLCWWFNTFYRLYITQQSRAREWGFGTNSYALW